MREVGLLPTQQVNRIKSYFPVAHGVPRVDDLRVISGILDVIRDVAFDGRTRRRRMGRTRRSITGLCGGVGRGSSTRSSASWRASPGPETTG